MVDKKKDKDYKDIDIKSYNDTAVKEVFEMMGKGLFYGIGFVCYYSVFLLIKLFFMFYNMGVGVVKSKQKGKK